MRFKMNVSKKLVTIVTTAVLTMALCFSLTAVCVREMMLILVRCSEKMRVPRFHRQLKVPCARYLIRPEYLGLKLYQFLPYPVRQGI